MFAGIRQSLKSGFKEAVAFGNLRDEFTETAQSAVRLVNPLNLIPDRPPDLSEAFRAEQNQHIFNIGVDAISEGKDPQSAAGYMLQSGALTAAATIAFQAKARKRAAEAFMDLIAFYLPGYTSIGDFMDDVHDYVQSLRDRLEAQEGRMDRMFGSDHLEKYAKMYLEEEDYTKWPVESEAQYELRMRRLLAEKLLDENGDVKDGLDEEAQSFAQELVRYQAIDRELRAGEDTELDMQQIANDDSLDDGEKAKGLKEQLDKNEAMKKSITVSSNKAIFENAPTSKAEFNEKSTIEIDFENEKGLDSQAQLNLLLGGNPGQGL